MFIGYLGQVFCHKEVSFDVNRRREGAGALDHSSVNAFNKSVGCCGREFVIPERELFKMTP